MINGRLGKRRNVIALGAILMISSAGILGMIRLSKRSPTVPTFVVEPGEFEIMAGTSSRDADLQKIILTVTS